MNPLLVIVAVFVVLIACGGLYDLRHRRLDAVRRNLGLEARTVREAAESHGSVVGRTSRAATAGRPVVPVAGQASAAGPRLVIWAAMIARWTSLVPSQMRSTRSSRKKRSATFSRM